MQSLVFLFKYVWNFARLYGIWNENCLHYASYVPIIIGNKTFNSGNGMKNSGLKYLIDWLTDFNKSKSFLDLQFLRQDSEDLERWQQAVCTHILRSFGPGECEDRKRKSLYIIPLCYSLSVCLSVFLCLSLSLYLSLSVWLSL